MAGITLKADQEKTVILSSGRSHQRGISLIELLAVLAIVSFSTAAASNLIHSRSPTAELRSVRTILIIDLIAQREKSLSQGSVSTITFTQSQYVIEESNIIRALPKNITLHLTNTAPRSIMFYDDGSSNGGVITLSKRRFTEAISINALTGQISVQ